MYYKLLYRTFALSNKIKHMAQEQLTPEQSLNIINRVLDKTRRRYEENGLIISLWGFMTMLAGITQYIMIRMGYGPSGYVWFVTMIPMFIFTLLYMTKERKEKKQKPGVPDVSGMTWLMAGCMAMLTGFVFGPEFGGGFVTAMFLPFCLAAFVSALHLRKTWFVWISIIGVIIAYATLHIPFYMHPLMVAVMACVLFLIPGLILRADYKKRHRV